MLRHSHGKTRELASGPEGSLAVRYDCGITRGLLNPFMAENFLNLWGDEYKWAKQTKHAKNIFFGRNSIIFVGLSL